MAQFCFFSKAEVEIVGFLPQAAVLGRHGAATRVGSRLRAGKAQAARAAAQRAASPNAAEVWV